jgi:Arc/MetJ family transcription regulator
MRTTLNIDDHLFHELMKQTHAKTKTEAVRIALTEYLRMKRKLELLALRGRLGIEDNWQRLRAREIEESPQI